MNDDDDEDEDEDEDGLAIPMAFQADLSHLYETQI